MMSLVQHILVLGTLGGCLMTLAAATAINSKQLSVLNGIQAEVLAWQSAGNADTITVLDSTGSLVSATVTSGELTSIFSTDYDKKVVFHLFTESDSSETEGTTVTLDKAGLLEAGWNKDLDVKIIVHGFSNNIESDVIQLIKDAYLEQGKFNVIGVDWGKLCASPLYLDARLHVTGTGERVGELIDYLLDNELTELTKVHLIGHSLGAHVVGVAGSSVSSGLVARVTGLDPALPLFALTDKADRLDSGDGTVVDVVHTSVGLGTPTALGTVDFYPNGGSNQPGCGLDLFGTCSHGRSYVYFAESILEGEGFASNYCTSTSNAQDGDCDDQVTGAMGDELTFSTSGAYYLKTAKKSPYNLS